MALQIGIFYQKGDHFNGMIETRQLTDLNTVLLEPHEKNQDHEPDYIVHTGRCQIGLEWNHTTKDGAREYVLCRYRHKTYYAKQRIMLRSVCSSPLFMH